ISDELVALNLELLTVLACFGLLQEQRGPALLVVRGRNEGGQQWSEHPGALLHLAFLAPLDLRRRAGKSTRNWTGRDPNAPPHRVVVRPLGQVSVEAADSDQDRVNLAAWPTI